MNLPLSTKSYSLIRESLITFLVLSSTITGHHPQDGISFIWSVISTECLRWCGGVGAGGFTQKVLFRIKYHRLAFNWFQPILHYLIPFFQFYANNIHSFSEEWRTDTGAGLIVLFPEQNTCSFPKHTVNVLQKETNPWSETKPGLKSSLPSLGWPKSGREPHCWGSSPSSHPACLPSTAPSQSLTAAIPTLCYVIPLK